MSVGLRNYEGAPSRKNGLAREKFRKFLNRYTGGDIRVPTSSSSSRGGGNSAFPVRGGIFGKLFSEGIKNLGFLP